MIWIRVAVVAGAIIVALLLLNFTIEAYGTTGNQNFLGADSTVVLVMVSLLIMIAGVVTGSAYRVALDSQRVRSLGWLVGKTLSDRSFILSLLVSPLVFLSVYASTGDNPLSGSSLLLLYENGFFCHAVFGRLFAAKYETGEVLPAST